MIRAGLLVLSVAMLAAAPSSQTRPAMPRAPQSGFAW